MAYKLLFVCLGNICRSPSAEGVMNFLIEQDNLEHVIQCDSAGTSSYHIGAAPDHRMTQAASRRGITLTGRARQLVPQDLQDFDLILAMDRENYHDILRLDPSQTFHHKVRMMCDFCTEHSSADVPDPYYGGTEGFNYVIELLMDACSGLLQHLKTKHLNEL
jgi:protein-tyrosine phosphatase